LARKNVKMTKHIKYIESMIEDPIAEEIGFSIFGESEGKLGELAATPKRVIFGSKTLFSGEAFEYVNYEDIHSLDYKENFKEAHLEIYIKNSSRKMSFFCTSKQGLRIMRDLINDFLDDLIKETNIQEEKSTIEELQKLVDLKENGYISDREFVLLKKNLIE